MNEYVVTVNAIKKKIKVEDNLLFIDDKKYNFELQPLNSNLFMFKIMNKIFEIYSRNLTEEKLSITLNGRHFEVLIRTSLQEKAALMMESKGQLNHHSEIKSPMPGLILKLKKKTGDDVEAGEPVLILEAMKMENELRSPSKGKIREILAKEGIAVEKGAVLFIIDQSLTPAPSPKERGGK